MRRVLYLMTGLLIAIVAGIVSVKFSAPAGATGIAAKPSPALSDGPAYGLMVGVAVACWVSAFLPMPGWLSVMLGGAIVWIGLAVMTVCGFFVYLQYPNNTLSDGAYAGFLCGIAMVASRFGSILRYMHRQGGS